MASSVLPDPMAQHFVECEHCETRPAQHFCNTCPGALCDICKDKHKRKKISHNHEVIPLVSSRKQTSSLCSVHRNKRCGFYCKPCKKPVCSECFTEKHKGHIIEKLSSFLEDQRKNLTQFINKIGTILIPAYDNLLTETKSKHTGVIKSAEEVRYSVQQHTENIIRAVKSAESDILDALDTSKSEALSSIQSDQGVLNDGINRLHEIKKTLHEMHDSNSVDETLFKQQISRIEEMETLPETMTIIPAKFVSKELDMSIIKLQIGNITSFGLKKTRRSRVDELSKPTRLVWSERKLIKKPVKKATLKVDLKEQYELRCMNTNTVFLRGNDNKIRIVDVSGKITTIPTSLPQDDWPRGMDLTKDNDIIYADKENRKVMRVSMNGDISTLFTLRTDYFPFGLSVTHSGNILISFILKTDYKDKGQRGKVLEYTTSGQIVKEFIKDGGRELFKRPLYVVKNSVNDDIIVRDYVLDRQRVIVLNGMGNLKFAYNGKELSKSDKFWPQQITCDSLCQILIADEYSDAIHVLSQDGHPLALLLTGELDQPMGVCFDGIDSIWIVELKSKKIKIYKYLE